MSDRTCACQPPLDLTSYGSANRRRRTVNLRRRAWIVDLIHRGEDPTWGGHGLANAPADNAIAPAQSANANPFPLASTPLIEFFDRVVVINLDRRPDRWERFQEHLAEIDWPFRQVERFRAIDGRIASPPPWWRMGGGAWGCHQSHVRIIEQALMDGVRTILVLEDDVVFVPNFRERVDQFLRALPSDWHQAYLGGQHLRQCMCPPAVVNDIVLRPFNVNRTHAYAIHSRFLLPAYRHLTNYVEHARHPGHHIDHRYGALHEGRKFNFYAPRWWIAGQVGSHSNISGRTTQTRFWSQIRPGRSEATFVAVIGLHRSGSSCLAGVLHKLGVYMGDQLSGYETYGGFESRRLANLCEAAYPFPTRELRIPHDEVVQRLREHIEIVRSQAVRIGCVAGGKYPHLCAMGDALEAACGPGLRLVHINRPLAESIASTQTRSRMAVGWLKISDDDAVSVQHWLWERKHALLSRHSHLTVNYADLLDDPRGQIDQLVEWLGIPVSPERVADAIAHVEPRQRSRSSETMMTAS